MGAKQHTNNLSILWYIALRHFSINPGILDILLTIPTYGNKCTVDLIVYFTKTLAIKTMFHLRNGKTNLPAKSLTGIGLVRSSGTSTTRGNWKNICDATECHTAPSVIQQSVIVSVKLAKCSVIIQVLEVTLRGRQISRIDSHSVFRPPKRGSRIWFTVIIHISSDILIGYFYKIGTVW